MPFILICHDETDADCLSRRMANREAHLKMVAEAVERGDQAFGCAITDDDGKMVGSLMVMNMKTREEVDAWLKVEPYVTGKVWGKIEVMNCAIPQLFSQFFKKSA